MRGEPQSARWVSLFLAPLLSASVLIAADPDGWNNVKNSIRNRAYVVLSRDGRCTVGRIASADGQSLQLQKGAYEPVSFQRAQILRVGEDATPHNTIYSGRSSWNDAKAASPQASEYLSVITEQGQELRFKKPNVTDNAISAGRTTVTKDEIRFVSYVRFRPISDSAEQNWREAGLIVWPVARLYQRTLPKISVLLYNSALKQDESPLGCKPIP